MDFTKFITILNSTDKPKKEILDAIGLSYTGFDRSVSRQTIKATTLEQFCIATGSHVSEFFPDWQMREGQKNFPNKVSEVRTKYESNYNKSINDVIRAKDDLIAEQRERINELSELISMFKSGKIKLSE